MNIALLQILEAIKAWLAAWNPVTNQHQDLLIDNATGGLIVTYESTYHGGASTNAPYVVWEDDATGLTNEKKHSDLTGAELHDPKPHDHDDRYYTEAETDALLAAQDELSELQDTDITTPQDGDALVYNATSGKWEGRKCCVPRWRIMFGA